MERWASIVTVALVACGFDSGGGSGGAADLGSTATESTSTSGPSTTAGPSSGPTTNGPTSAPTAGTLTTMGSTSVVTTDTTYATETQTTSAESGSTSCVEAMWYGDGDMDGWGDDEKVAIACEPPEGFVGQGGDCDDGNENRNPGLDELCDGVDNDCDDKVDEHSPSNTACKGCTSDDADGIAFYVCPIATRWTIAETDCQTNFYGELASLHTAAQQAAVYQQLSALSLFGAWIGLNDIGNEGTFSWNDGTAVDYTNWHPTEPDDLNGQDCAIVNAGDTGLWYDRDCSNPGQSHSDSYACADPDF